MLKEKAIELGGRSYFSEKKYPTLGEKGQNLVTLPDEPLQVRATPTSSSSSRVTITTHLTHESASGALHFAQYEGKKAIHTGLIKTRDSQVPSVQQVPRQQDGCGRERRLRGTEHQADPWPLSPSLAGKRGSRRA